ncbi:YtxH domain-containing protein [Rudanella lutea]|uniref:YtxH domain-containing protein n=1 Tax=Rudanella lutea TaxID=451374 RepID=UPI00036FBD65|nr:YtxH domain-containing protein [Rudanella lutea]
MRSTRDFLTGVLTGVAIGLLTAPRSGKETRDKLKEEANKRSGDLKDQWNKGVEQVKQGYEQAKTQVSEYTDKAKQQLNEYKSQAQNEYDKQRAKSQYNDTVDQLADQTESGINSTRESLKID